jgi:hypothetical protein
MTGLPPLCNFEKFSYRKQGRDTGVNGRFYATLQPAMLRKAASCSKEADKMMTLLSPQSSVGIGQRQQMNGKRGKPMLVHAMAGPEVL